MKTFLTLLFFPVFIFNGISQGNWNCDNLLQISNEFYINSVYNDFNQNYYVYGITDKNYVLKKDKSGQTDSIKFQNNDTSLFLIVFDSNLNKKKATILFNLDYPYNRFYPLTSEIFEFELDFDSDGNIYFTVPEIKYNINFPSKSISFNNMRESLILKYDKNINLIWEKKIERTQARLTGLKIHNDSIIYFFGNISNEIKFGDTIIKGNGLFLFSTDSSGNYKWGSTTKKYGSGPFGSAEILTESIETSDENIFIIGLFNGDSIEFSKDVVLDNKNKYHQYSIFIVKYNTNGIPIKVKGAGGSQDDFIYSSTISDKEDIYIAGQSLSPIIYFDDSYIIGKEFQLSYYLMKYDKELNVKWLTGDSTNVAIRPVYKNSDNELAAYANYIYYDSFNYPNSKLFAITDSMWQKKKRGDYIISIFNDLNKVTEHINPIFSENYRIEPYINELFYEDSLLRLNLQHPLLTNKIRDSIIWGFATFYSNKPIVNFKGKKMICDTNLNHIFLYEMRKTKPTISIDEHQNDLNISVYPNPTFDNNIFVENNSNDNVLFHVLDINGKQVFKPKPINSNQSVKIDASRLKKGIYFIELQNVENKKVKNFKFIKQ